MAQLHNPPDHDEAPPPYSEAANTAYNPAFMPNLTSHQANTHASATSIEPGTPSTAPSAPPLSTIADSAPSTPLPQSVSPLGIRQENMYPGGVSSPQQLYPRPTYYHQQQQQHLVSGPQQQYYYQTMPIPQQHHQQENYFPGGWMIPQQLPQRHQRPFIDSSERRFPVAALFFLFGWQVLYIYTIQNKSLTWIM
ncbi:hypothetical protein LRAMOSA08018 [Lichtheimia ramosa]|uniref:Uncharacterized protein n=1 Tax=Lichtheimia ramosa TaxID=688394 RepID=A0A077WDN6_9FUNG|nr:hypothetical protein LRAMOSA08018 [Lichtheimia ramosa]